MRMPPRILKIGLGVAVFVPLVILITHMDRGGTKTSHSDVLTAAKGRKLKLQPVDRPRIMPFSPAKVLPVCLFVLCDF